MRLQALNLNVCKLLVVDQEHNDIGPFQGTLGVAKYRAFQCSGHGPDVRLDDADFPYTGIDQAVSDLQCRTLPQVIDVCLEGQSEAGNLRLLKASSSIFDLFQYPVRFSVVDLSRSPDQLGLIRSGVNDELRIDCDAMSADTRTRLKDVDPGVSICVRDQFPNTDVKRIADGR